MTTYIEKICLLCGNNKNVKIKFEQNFKTENINSKTFSARRVSEHYHYRILECSVCGLVFSSPILPFDEISKLYKESRQTYDEETNDIAYSYMLYINQNSNLFKRGRVLEVGCGNGFFLNSLKKNGFKEVHGVEPSEEAVAKAGEFRSLILNSMIETENYPENYFDLICCFQTLDHLANPFEMLKRFYRLLLPGGMVYIIVHNQKGMQAKVFGEKSPIYDVEHIYLFNKNTLSHLCMLAGFQVVKIFSIKNIYSLSYWIKMTPLPFKTILSKLVSLIGMANFKVGIHPGNIGIFIQKPEL
ncbi:MAG: class I SAM-dependent methyltransferase [Bacteroidetes bacterium]|nr:class I SAM-dependent methyltransferase [Bacteroidota bacterium]